MTTLSPEDATRIEALEAQNKALAEALGALEKTFLRMMNLSCLQTVMISGQERDVRQVINGECADAALSIRSALKAWEEGKDG